MPAVITAERTLIEMGGKDLEALFAALKSLTDGQDDLRKDLREIRVEMGEMRRNINDNMRQLGVMEVNLDGVDAKVTELNCKQHAAAIRKIDDFILTQETKKEAEEKVYLGISSKVWAIITVIGLILAMTVNYLNIQEKLERLEKVRPAAITEFKKN